MIGRIQGDKLVVATRANPTVLAMLPQLEGRRIWLKGGGLSVDNSKHNRLTLERMLPDLKWEGGSEHTESFDLPSPPAEFKFKRKPDPHQLIALERCSQQQHFGLFMEQGTGKTKVAIDRACQLFSEQQITGVLVFTKKGVHRQWVEAELPKDHGPAYVGDWWKGKALPDDLLVQSESLKWFSINYDALRSDKAFEVCLAFARAHNGKLLVISDESQCIKGHTSTRHKRVSSFKLFSKFRLILTGTPIAKDLTDEWAQLKWLNQDILGVKYITTFRTKYCIMGGFEGRSVVGAKNLDDFKQLVAPHTYRVTKQEIGYIPKRYSEWLFDLNPEQRQLIKQVKQELIAELKDGGVVPITSASAAFVKVQQIANGFIIDENGKVVRLMPLDKNPRCIALLEWLDANEGKAVVWTRFTADRALAREAMCAAGIKLSEYTGSDTERHEAKRNFVEGDARVFLANPQSAGTGLDGLQTVCTQALYYSNSFNSIDRWQSEDRIDRRGMIGGSNYTDLIAKGSLDRYTLNNLHKKKGLSNMTLGDIDEAFEIF